MGEDRPASPPVDDRVVSVYAYSTFLDAFRSSFLFFESDLDRLEKTDEIFLREILFNLLDTEKFEGDRVGNDNTRLDRLRGEKLELDRLGGERVDETGDATALLGVKYLDSSSSIDLLPV